MIIIVLLVFALGIGSSASTDENLENRMDSVNHLLDGMIADDGPGIQYVIVSQDTTYSYVAGMADIQKGGLLTDEHTMAAFSMTKIFTAIAILQIVEQEEIDLDDQVSTYVSHPYNPSITIRQLLTHSAGIPNPIPLRWVHLAKDHQTFDEQKIRSAVLQKHSKSIGYPGEKYKYSNIGYWLLGAVIEKVSGLKYAEYVHAEIFQPLQLTSDELSFQIVKQENHAKGYLKKFSFLDLMKLFVIDRYTYGEYEGKWLKIENLYLNGQPFGGAIGTAKAISKVLNDLLQDDSVLLGRNMKKELFTQQHLETGESIHMALGWHIGYSDEITYYYHQGGGAGFRSEMRIYPDYGLASVIMTNRTSFKTKKWLNELDQTFMHQKGQ